jgi:hypothetical protein
VGGRRRDVREAPAAAAIDIMEGYREAARCTAITPLKWCLVLRFAGLLLGYAPYLNESAMKCC